jgi:hypothetical protein
MMTSLQTSSSLIYLFGINLSNYSRLAQFLLTSTAVLVFHVAQGYIQVFRKSKNEYFEIDLI